MGKLKDEPREKLGQQVGKQMGAQHPPPGHPQPPGGPEERGLLQLEHLPPNQPGQGGPMGEGHPRNHPPEAPPAGQGDQDNEENVGNPQHQVDDPGDESVHPGAADGGGSSQQQGDSSAEDGGEGPYPYAQRQPGHGAGQHVPAHPVGAEGVGKAGGQIFPGKVGKLSRFGQSFSGQSNYEQ